MVQYLQAAPHHWVWMGNGLSRNLYLKPSRTRYPFIITSGGNFQHMTSPLPPCLCSSSHVVFAWGWHFTLSALISSSLHLSAQAFEDSFHQAFFLCCSNICPPSSSLSPQFHSEKKGIKPLRYPTARGFLGFNWCVSFLFCLLTHFLKSNLSLLLSFSPKQYISSVCNTYQSSRKRGGSKRGKYFHYFHKRVQIIFWWNTRRKSSE